MALTDQQKTDVITAMTGATGGGGPGVAIRNWILNEGLTGTNVQSVRQELMNTRKPELVAAQGPIFIDRIANNFISCTGSSGCSGPTVAQCDALLAALQDAEILIETKKTELEG